MKRIHVTLRDLADPDHIASSLDLTVRGKRSRRDVALLLFRREAEIHHLSQALADGTWSPSGLRVHWLLYPKKRPIARARIQDRVVHTAVVRLLEPAVLRSASPAAMASVRGAGTARAVLAVQRGMRRHRYAMHLDLRAYFPSIDPARVQAMWEERVADPGLREVILLILQQGRGLYASSQMRAALHLGPHWPRPQVGLPIGSAFSRLVANHLYLEALDHHIQRVLRVPDYLRYVDDLVLFGESRAILRDQRDAIAAWLWEHRELRLKHPEAPVLSCRGTLGVLGHFVHRDSFEPFVRTTRKLMAKLRRAALWGDPQMERRIAGSLGWLKA